MTRPSRFSFVDEGEAVRRLGVDRATVLEWVKSGKLRAYPGVGKGNFFRVGDIDALAASLAPATEEETTDAAQGARRQHDPAYKVHLRLQADLKWLDLNDDDLQAWVRELHPAAYEKQRGNVLRVREKLDRLISLMDGAATRWHAQDRPTPHPPAPLPKGEGRGG